LIVRALDAGGATRALGYAHSILGLGCAAVAGFSGCYTVRILLGDSSIAGMRVDDSGAIGPLGYGHSICALDCATVTGLSSGHPVRVLVDDSSIAGVGVNGNRSLTIAANGPTTRVLYAISRK
jgi:hypothetical protein